MTREAQKHLARAKEYVAKGEQFYRKAAAEIRAARDAGASIRDAADVLERSERWVAAISAWDKSPGKSMQGTADLPFSEPQGAVAKRHAKGVLREMPAIVRELAPTEQRKLRAELDAVEQERDRELRERVDAKERRIHGDASQDRVQKHEREIGFLDDLHSARSRVLFLVKKLHDLELSDEISEECSELFDDIHAAAGMGIAFLDKGERFDDELAELLAEGR